MESFSLTIFTTVFAGTLVFVLGQLFLKLVLEPVHNFKHVIAETSDALIVYQRVYLSDAWAEEAFKKEASETFRQLAGKLHGAMYLIPGYWLNQKIFFLPKREKIRGASHLLIQISNCIPPDSLSIFSNSARRQRISDALGIYMPEDERWTEESIKQYLDES